MTGNLGLLPTLLSIGVYGGMACTIPRAVVQVTYSDDYRAWKGQIVEEKVSKIFKDFLVQDEVLKGYLYLGTDELIVIPFKGPDGITYERDEIVERIQAVADRIQTKNLQVNAGLYGADFTENDLIFNHDWFVEVTRRVNFLLKNELGRKDLEPNNIKIIKDGLMAYQMSCKTFYCDLFKQLIDQSVKKHDGLKEKEIQDGKDVFETTLKYEKLHQEERQALGSSFSKIVF